MRGSGWAGIRQGGIGATTLQRAALGEAKKGEGERKAMTHTEAKTLRESQGSQRGWRHSPVSRAGSGQGPPAVWCCPSPTPHSAACIPTVRPGAPLWP